MSGEINIPPPLTCGACGALVDERQAWHRWPHRMPDASGDYIVLLQAPDTRAYQEIAQWRSEDAGWRLDEGGFTRCHGAGDPWPLAWRHLPPLPEWTQ